MISFLRSKESEVDFNNIIPMPLELRDIVAGGEADYAWAYYLQIVLENSVLRKFIISFTD